MLDALDAAEAPAILPHDLAGNEVVVEILSRLQRNLSVLCVERRTDELRRRRRVADALECDQEPPAMFAHRANAYRSAFRRITRKRRAWCEERSRRTGNVTLQLAFDAEETGDPARSYSKGSAASSLSRMSTPTGFSAVARTSVRSA